VAGTFWNTPRPCRTLATWMMSLSLSVRNRPSFQSPRPPAVLMLPRSPASRVRATTWFSGGSETRNPSSRQGLCGFEQPSSSGVGARFASEYPA
jgi:hypothetical protein